MIPMNTQSIFYEREIGTLIFTENNLYHDILNRLTHRLEWYNATFTLYSSINLSSYLIVSSPENWGVYSWNTTHYGFLSGYAFTGEYVPYGANSSIFILKDVSVSVYVEVNLYNGFLKMEYSRVPFITPTYALPLKTTTKTMIPADTVISTDTVIFTDTINYLIFFSVISLSLFVIRKIKK